MYTKKRVVAMLLAGGQGSRLYALTKNVAKPAVPYGGKYPPGGWHSCSWLEERFRRSGCGDRDLCQL